MWLEFTLFRNYITACSNYIEIAIIGAFNPMTIVLLCVVVFHESSPQNTLKCIVIRHPNVEKFIFSIKYKIWSTRKTEENTQTTSVSINFRRNLMVSIQLIHFNSTDNTTSTKSSYLTVKSTQN